MNEEHAKLCSSPEWAACIQDEVLPALARHADLGADMLEIGPGPGAATEWLRHIVRRLTAVEADATAARKLADRYRGGNVDVAVGSATDLVQLQTLGFGKIAMMVDWDLRFVAHKPAGPDACGDDSGPVRGGSGGSSPETSTA